MQHLRIMESLGGDTRWSDRFLARHAAIIYFLVLTLVSQLVCRMGASFVSLYLRLFSHSLGEETGVYVVVELSVFGLSVCLCMCPPSLSMKKRAVSTSLVIHCWVY